jgi:hypothetical protein
VNIVNFHTSWRDGLGFCALLHYFAPEDVDYEKLKAEPAVLKRLEVIFDIGDDLGVANILDPEDMLIEPHPDQFSVITYLSQVFHRFKGQPRGGQQAAKRPADLDASALRLAQQNCHVCQSLLTGDVIEAFGRTVHTRCFTCVTCGSRLGRQFVDVDDKPYCDVCGKAAFVASVAAKQQLGLAAGVSSASASDASDKAALDRQMADEQRRIAEREAAATARLNEQRDALRKREADERAKFAQAEQVVTNKMKEQRDALAAKKRERLETLGHSDAPRLQSLRKPKMGGRRAPTPGVRPGAKLDTHADAPSTREAAADATPTAAPTTATSSGGGGGVGVPRGIIKPGGMPGNQGALAAAAASMAGSLKRGGGAAGGGVGRGGGPTAQQRQAEANKAAADERAKLEAQKRRELDAARATREAKAAAELAEREAKAKVELQRVVAEAKAQSEREAAARAREAAARDAEREARELAEQKSAEERKRAAEERAREQERAAASAKRREEDAIASRRAELERQQREEAERRRRDEAALRAQEEERMKRDLDAAASRISQLFLELGDDVDGTTTATTATTKSSSAVDSVSDEELAGVRQADGTILLPSGVLLPALPGAGTKVRALFDYLQAQDAGELTFRRGDVVVVIERGEPGAWWSGMLGDAVGLFPSNFFSSRGRRICGPGDEEVDSDDEDDTEDDGNTDEFEREERMLEELERKKLGELAAERTRRKEEILKAELAAERAAEEERGRLAREREQIINRMQTDWAERKRTRTRTLTDASLGALDDKAKAAIDAQYQAKVAASATRAAALEAGGKDGHVRTMTLSTNAADGSAAAITVDALLQGFLNKRDGRGFGTIKKWRKRYYVLRDGQMIAYPDKPTKGMAPTGVIALEFVEKVEPSGRDAFVIHTSEKKYHLDALGDVAMATKWTEALEAAVAIAKNPPSTRGGGAAAASALPDVEGATAATWQRKSGWLERHGGGAFQAQWSKVWVVMKGGVVFTFSKPGAKQQQKVSLYKAVLDEYKPHKYDGVTFMITTQNESEKKGKPSEIIFRCKNQQEMHDWLNTLLRQKLKIEESVDMIAI